MFANKHFKYRLADETWQMANIKIFAKNLYYNIIIAKVLRFIKSNSMLLFQKQNKQTNVR